MSYKLLQIGAICRPHGLRGELRVRLHDPSSQALLALKRLWTGPDRGDVSVDEAGLSGWKVHTVRQLGDGYYLLTLHGISDRSGAEALRAQRLYAERGDLPALVDGEIYVADLIGCKVVDLEGHDIGTAREVQDIAGNSLLLVERPSRDAVLVPLVPQILIDVDLQASVVRIDPPEGLLDLDIGPHMGLGGANGVAP